MQPQKNQSLSKCLTKWYKSDILKVTFQNISYNISYFVMDSTLSMKFQLFGKQLVNSGCAPFDYVISALHDEV